MWKKVREIKKRSKRKNWFLTSVIIFFLCLSALLTYYLPTHYFFKKASFISPVPVAIGGSNDQIEHIRILLKKNNIAFTTVSAFPEGSFTVTLAGGEEIFFSQQKNIESQISSLQLIVSRLTIEGKRFSRLDFRFDEPVITLR